MTTQAATKLERMPKVIKRYGLSRSTFYTRIKDGLIPPPVSLGNRAVAWVEQENTTVLTAMIAGKSKEEIKALVRSLIKERSKLESGEGE
ncbi:helix-turn-helix transcriptional regulator [Photobacterium lipolyticum]|uniref:Transcriptional regulator n=1 Tax=Photobacterium lipolyticum TaxID=266810 RepID=A0A2T3MTD9_9GAMM|nr:AlpA family phage regulatory protein [Photobacterium lipolyticum]PSW02558.1 transcriptional regulator [Photobacterium lipolyticum]